jgi:LDH2 family malate/lactate/ureidoglycolate dehydrogenase
LDVSGFMDLNALKARVNHMIDELKSTPPMEGAAGIFMPGEIEYGKEMACRQNGILIDLEVCKTLDALATKIDIPRLT